MTTKSPKIVFAIKAENRAEELSFVRTMCEAAETFDCGNTYHEVSKDFGKSCTLNSAAGAQELIAFVSDHGYKAEKVGEAKVTGAQITVPVYQLTK